jgi:hypothetical protein
LAELTNRGLIPKPWDFAAALERLPLVPTVAVFASLLLLSLLGATPLERALGYEPSGPEAQGLARGLILGGLCLVVFPGLRLQIESRRAKRALALSWLGPGRDGARLSIRFRSGWMCLEVPGRRFALRSSALERLVPAAEGLLLQVREAGWLWFDLRDRSADRADLLALIEAWREQPSLRLPSFGERRARQQHAVQQHGEYQVGEDRSTVDPGAEAPSSEELAWLSEAPWSAVWRGQSRELLAESPTYRGLARLSPNVLVAALALTLLLLWIQGPLQLAGITFIFPLLSIALNQIDSLLARPRPWLGELDFDRRLALGLGPRGPVLDLGDRILAPAWSSFESIHERGLDFELVIDRWNCLRLPAQRLDPEARRHLEGARTNAATGHLRAVEPSPRV